MYKPLKYLLFVAMIILAVRLMAHEFWLQPSKFIYKMGDVANIKFNVGENFTGDNWVGNHDKINQLLHVSPKGLATDISERLGNNKGDSVQLSIMEEGTHMILFNSKNSFIKLKAEKFNNYLKEDGLQTAIDYRKLHNEDSLEGKEYYQRSVKTILQCGNATTNKCTRRTQLPLDIVPEINPYEPIILGRVLEHNRWYTIYFNKKPTVSKEYNILPYLPDTLNVPKYLLTDTSVYLIVTEIVKTGKTWVGKGGKVNVSVQSSIPKVLFNNIRCRNISNVSDTLSVSGDIGCQ